MSLNNLFKLDDSFVAKYSKVAPSFGFNGLGEVVYRRTYSRDIRDDKGNVTKEDWYQTVRRVVEGCYNIQKGHIENNKTYWNPHMAQKSAQEMYDRMFKFKFLPPGRGLFAMTNDVIKNELGAALSNCAFTSTKDIANEPYKPFTFLMSASMHGVGCGFDSRGVGKIVVKGDDENKSTKYTVQDSRQGWVDSLEVLLKSHFEGGARVHFDYSLVRKAGEALKTFGGVSSGPAPLAEMHKSIHKHLDEVRGRPISVTTINNIMNMIGCCVVAGGIRRSSEISFGDPFDEEFLKLKDYKINKERESYGWASNNSIFAKIGMDYTRVAEQMAVNGEPGVIWMENVNKYSRMDDMADNKDEKALGANPCNEQSLEHMELCCLVELFPTKATDLEDFLRTIKFAYLYAKTVTLAKTPWMETNAVIARNRRIGCSMTGITQFLSQYNMNDLKKWCEEAYKAIRVWDAIYSDWFAIPRSIKVTSIKPSGTISLLPGVTPGMHWIESRYHIRRVRIGVLDPLIPKLRDAGYHIEPCAIQPTSTFVVSFPIDMGPIRAVSEVSMWEQLSLAAFLQRYYSDNQVSVTVTFKKDEGKDIANALNYFQYLLKGVSFLPYYDAGESPYPQMPYEKIDESKYREMASVLRPLQFRDTGNQESEHDGESLSFCDGGVCMRRV